jgi:hypothetical protein
MQHNERERDWADRTVNGYVLELSNDFLNSL